MINSLIKKILVVIISIFILIPWFVIDISDVQAGGGTSNIDTLYWRYRDDTTALNTDGGWLATQNTQATDLVKGATYRLRINISQEGTKKATASPAIQWGTSSDCTTGTWTTFADAGATTTEHFEITDSTQYVEGDLTTTNLLTASAGTWIDGEGLDSTATASPLTYDVDEYSENEYSFTPTTNATDGSTYYMRISSNNSYTACASVTLETPTTYTISGTAYTDDTEGTTLNSSGGAIKLVNSTTGDTYSDVDGTDASGLWSISVTNQPSNGDDLVIWLDGATADGTLVATYGATCTGTPDCTGLKIYQDRVIVRDENSTTITNADLADCDNDSGTNCADTEIGFTSNAGTLTVSSSRIFYIWTGDEFVPGGTTIFDDIKIVGTYTASASESITVSGDWVNTGTFTANTSSIIMSGTGTYTSGGSTVNNLTLSGTITLAAATHAIVGNLDMTGGSVTATGSTVNMSGTSKTVTSATNPLNHFTISGGSISNVDAMTVDGNYNLTAGTFTQGANVNLLIYGDAVNIASGAIFTKASGSGILIMDGLSDDQWFEDLNGTKQDMGAVQIGQSPGTTKLKSDFAASSLTIPTGDTFETHGWEVDLSGSLDCQGACNLDLTDGVPSNEGDGTIITVGGNWTMSATGNFTPSTDSRVEPDGTVDQTITTGAKPFWDFYVNNAGSTDTVDDVIISGTLDVDGALTVNDGELELDTNDPNVDVEGVVTINTNGEILASNSGSFNAANNWSNSGAFTSNSSTITFDGADSSTQLFAGNTSFNNFVASTSANSAGRTLRFTASSTQTVTGTWTITGFSGKIITLESSSSPTQWTINPTAASVTYVQVSDSNNTGVLFCASYSTDTGNNNTSWDVQAASCGITVSGNLYSNETPTAYDCSADTAVTIKVSVDGAVATTADCVLSTGAFSVVANTPAGAGSEVVVYVDSAETPNATTITLAADTSSDITGLNLYQNRVAVRHETAGPMTNALMGTGDNGDAGIRYSVASSNLTTDSGMEVHVWTSDTFTPGGTITTQGGGDIHIDTSGIFNAGGNAIIVNGSWDNDGTFNHGNNTVTFNSTAAGELVESGGSSFYNVIFNDASGGWTIQTNNMTVNQDLNLSAANSFTVASGITLEVQGAMAHTVTGANTTWTGSTLYLNGSGGIYDINVKTHGGDTYATLRVGASEDIAMWDSSASTYTIDSGACLYSQDHGATAGRLNIYGDCNSRTNEYWTYAKDFDGAAVTRQVDVQFADGATFTVDNGDTLEVTGQSTSTNRTLVSRISTGNYSMTVNGTLDAQYYDFDYLDASGLNFSSTGTVTELSDGSFDNAGAGASSSYITVTNITSSKNFFNNTFDDNGDATDTNVVYNVNADGSGIYWTFFNFDGNKGGESYDNEVNSAFVGWNAELSMSINDTVMNLGTLNTLIVGSDTHNLTVTTNATNGYTCRATEDGELRQGADDIDQVADGTVTAGSEEYGISCAGADCQLSGDNALSGTPLVVAQNAAPIEAALTTVSYKAAASSATAGGQYSHSVTFTCSGDF